MIKGDEVSESAKAVQEVAKTSNTAIEAVRDLGGFVSRIIGKPIEEAAGILTDKITYSRWERRERLKDRANKFIAEKNIEEELRPVPPKIALPVIENASLEEDDELQDIWAQFIASAVDPNYDGSLRTAFIDIIKQLEVVDVHILNFIFSNYKKSNADFVSGWDIISKNNPTKKFDGNTFPVSSQLIVEELEIDEDTYKESIDNLIRVRCVASHIRNQSINIPNNSRTTVFDRVVDSLEMYGGEKVNFNITHIYDMVCITSLGISFATACMRSKAETDSNVD